MEASGSQVSGRGGWDPGLLGHVCACARVRMCTLGLLVSSDGGGILQEENIPSCKKGAGGGEAILSPSSGSSFPPSSCSDVSRLREKKHCIQREGSDWSLQKVLGRAGEERAVLQPALFFHHPPWLCIALDSEQRARLWSLAEGRASVAGPARYCPLSLGHSSACSGPCLRDPKPKLQLQIGALIFLSEDLDRNADLEYSLSPMLCLTRTADASRGPFQL